MLFYDNDTLNAVTVEDGTVSLKVHSNLANIAFISTLDSGAIASDQTDTALLRLYGKPVPTFPGTCKGNGWIYGLRGFTDYAVSISPSESNSKYAIFMSL